nr:hypothetical protein [Tanacetum cinerariifolium]
MVFRLVDGNSFDCPPDSYHPPHPTYKTYSGDSCGNDSHFGYDYPLWFPLNYEPEPGYIQNYNSYPHDSSSFPQQYPCCEDCGVTHEPYQCQPTNHDYYHKQNSCYDSNSIGFDQFQPQQYTVTHSIFSAHHDLLGSQKELNITLTKESSNSLEDNIISELPSYSALTPSEPVDFLNMRDEHVNTIPATELDEFLKSCVDNLIPNPSESEGENECDLPAGFTTFSNVLFDADYDFGSSDDQSLSDEDFPKKYSNPLFDEEIIPMEIDQHSFNAESDLKEAMPNHDSSIIISLKIDSLFDEFTGELTLLKSFSPKIDETNCHPEKEIRFTKRLLYGNSSPRPPEEIVSDNSNADIESFSPSPIPNEDSDSHMEEIDLSFNTDDPMLPGIEDDDYDSGRDISILEELLDNYSLSLPDDESYHFDIPSPYRPPAKPPDGNTGTLNIKMMGDISERKVPIPNLTITLVSNQEKSLDFLPHLGLEIFQPSAKCPMMINGKNTPILDVPLFHFYPPLINSSMGGIRKKEKLQQLDQWAYLSTHHSKRLNSFCYDDDDDEDYTLAVTPVLSTEEPDNSLSMGDEHLDTIPATESDEVIKSSVENIIPIPSESEGIPEHMCDVSFHDNSPPLDISKDQFEDFSESNDEFSLIDDDSFSFDKIDYVEASPLDSELVSSEVMEIVIPKVGGIDDYILLPIKDDILRENLLNTKSSSTSLNSLLEETNNFDNSLLEFTTFSNVLFVDEDESDSSDDQSCSDEDDSDSLIEEIDLFCTPDYPMPPSIEDDDYDSERDILILKDLPSNNTLSFPEKESLHFDIPSFSRPPVKPPDGDT